MINKKPAGRNIQHEGFFKKNMVFLLLAIVVIITIIIYYPALHHKFTNWDDNDYITDNPYIKSLTPENIRFIFTEPMALNYHPLTMLSLALNYRLSGLEPFSYFLVNILLHLFNTLLIFYLAFLLLGRKMVPALFIAAIFAVHPMHVESVAWISERKDVLYSLFFLSGLIIWMFFIGRRRWYWYLAALLLSVLAGLSKPSAVVFPLVLFIIDYLNKRKFNSRLILEKLPFLVVSILFGIATLHAQVGKSVVDIRHYNLIQQFLFASYGFFAYIYKLFFPVGLSALHPVPVFNTSLDLPWLYFAAPVINIVIVGIVIYSMRKTRMLIFGLMFYFLNIMLTLQFVQVGSAVIAERYTYISYFGLLMGLAFLLNLAAEKYKKWRKGVYALMILFFAVMAIGAMQRVSVWKNSGTLWSDVISEYPESYTAYNNRGYFYVQEKSYDKALLDFNKAIDLLPGFVSALNNRGGLFRLLDEPRLAIADYTKALAIDSAYVQSLSGRGNAYATLGILDSALVDLNKAFAINPLLATTLGDRGEVLFKMGKFEEAIEDCNYKISVFPDNTDAYLNRGVAYCSLQKWEKAIPDFSLVLNKVKNNATIYEWRGVAFRSVGSYQEAVSDFSLAIQLAGTQSSLYVERAKAYKQAGMDKQAAEDIVKARQLGADVSMESVFFDLK
ncbi:MAG TPA: glycosyltransferase family 39 protein [Bacteroidales bacterium]|nr:glycosyltransferase family 39 protein [Bacteroidales bacterium]